MRKFSALNCLLDKIMRFYNEKVDLVELAIIT